ncbi:MAG: hypothetical protein JO039_07755 [Solirubrobacterales bacterium]|nr:hypothetical protein [Solirubrobacterales bacterium]
MRRLAVTGVTWKLVVPVFPSVIFAREIAPRGMNAFVNRHVTSAPLRIVTWMGRVVDRLTSLQVTLRSRQRPSGEVARARGSCTYQGRASPATAAR